MRYRRFLASLGTQDSGLLSMMVEKITWFFHYMCGQLIGDQNRPMRKGSDRLLSVFCNWNLVEDLRFSIVLVGPTE